MRCCVYLQGCKYYWLLLGTVNHHDVFTGSHWKLTPVSRDAWWASTLEPSVVDVTTSATMLTGSGLTTLVMTGWLWTGLMRNSLE